MAMDIWGECHGSKQMTDLTETVWRMVESQQVTSTRKLVDSLEEQDILEDLIESVKPDLPIECRPLHPLLYTAFRYPPLKHGSRFGTSFERALWYGSLTLQAVMAEKAFYQFNFLRASHGHFGLVEMPLTAFSILVNTQSGIQLTLSPFSGYTNIISSPVSYQATQALGQQMRQQGVEAFSYQSARDPRGGINVGLFTPRAFKRKHPDKTSLQTWRCLATKEKVDFVQISAIHNVSHHFALESFLVNEVLPFPAV